ncbi:unnamed protein product [Effrenium voratum]|nr:unnamed protein product [Effrenium voratum]
MDARDSTEEEQEDEEETAPRGLMEILKAERGRVFRELRQRRAANPGAASAAAVLRRQWCGGTTAEPIKSASVCFVAEPRPLPQLDTREPGARGRHLDERLRDAEQRHRPKPPRTAAESPRSSRHDASPEADVWQASPPREVQVPEVPPAVQMQAEAVSSLRQDRRDEARGNLETRWETLIHRASTGHSDTGLGPIPSEPLSARSAPRQVPRPEHLASLQLWSVQQKLLAGT